MPKSWFKFNNGSGVAPELNPINYSKISSTSCTDGSDVCAIYADVQRINSIDRPLITTELQMEIQTAMGSGTATPNVKLYIP